MSGLENPRVNHRGVKVSCFGYETDGEMEWCKILKEWYNHHTKELCKGCPFYKTPQQVAAGK